MAPYEASDDTVRAAVRLRTMCRTVPYGGSYGAVRRLVRSYCDDLDLYQLTLGKDLDSSPENENKEHEKAKEHCHIVHGAQHYNQLSPEVGKEADQFQNTQQSKCS